MQDPINPIDPSLSAEAPSPDLKRYAKMAENQMADHQKAAQMAQALRPSQELAPEVRRSSPQIILFLLSGLVAVFVLMNLFWIALRYFEDQDLHIATTNLAEDKVNSFRSTPAATNPAGNDAGQAVFYFNKGMTFLQSGEYNDALRMFETAQGYDPAFVEAYVNAAFACLKTDDLAAAFHHLQVAYKFDPNHPRTLLLLGIANGLKGDFENAQLYLERVIILAPQTIFAQEASATLAELEKNGLKQATQKKQGEEE